jgi:hypothetical protein
MTMGGARKYVAGEETRAVRKIHIILRNVNIHRTRAFDAGRKPDLEYKAEKGAILSLLLLKTKGKRNIPLKVRP